MGFSFDTESGHLRELFGTEVLAEENNLADFWGSFQDLILKNYNSQLPRKISTLLIPFFDTLKGVELTFIV